MLNLACTLLFKSAGEASHGIWLGPSSMRSSSSAANGGGSGMRPSSNFFLRGTSAILLGGEASFGEARLPPKWAILPRDTRVPLL